MTCRVINLGPSHRKTFPLRSLRYFVCGFLSRKFTLDSTANEKLRAHGKQRGKANEDVARLAGLQLREERSADDDEGHDEQNPWITPPEPRGGNRHAEVQNVEQRESKCDFKIDGIAAPTLRGRPEPARVRQQGNPRREPHSGGPLDGNPQVRSNGMTPRAFTS